MHWGKGEQKRTGMITKMRTTKMNVHIPVSPGELADKLTILEIKNKKIKQALKRLKNNCTYLKLLGSYPVAQS